MSGETIPPILCAHLLGPVDERLIELLGSLSASDWELKTIAPRWKVRDVAAHLLDTVLRKLSIVRDACWVEPVEDPSRQDVVALVNRLNSEGVAVFRRLSPNVLIDLMKLACEQSARFHESLDPFARALFNVSWAGEEKSLNWFDTARELTERWHHQQQIRLATNRPGLMEPEFYHPVLDCFMRGLPYHYRNVDAQPGTCILVEISGDSGGQWFLSKDNKAWRLVRDYRGNLASRVRIPQDLAWRLFTKGIDRNSARTHIQIEGDPRLGEVILAFTAIVG